MMYNVEEGKKKIQMNHIRTIFLSDLHIPYQDTNALALAMDIIKDYKLIEQDNIIIGGDLVDFYPFSSFPTDLINENIDTYKNNIYDWCNVIIF